TCALPISPCERTIDLLFSERFIVLLADFRSLIRAGLGRRRRRLSRLMVRWKTRGVESMSRAATTRLDPGEHSIDRAHVFPYRDGFAMRWSIRLHSGRLMRPLTQGPTKGKVRARARARAADLLSGSGDGGWKGTSKT